MSLLSRVRLLLNPPGIYTPEGGTLDSMSGVLRNLTAPPVETLVGTFLVPNVDYELDVVVKNGSAQVWLREG